MISPSGGLCQEERAPCRLGGQRRGGELLRHPLYYAFVSHPDRARGGAFKKSGGRPPHLWPGARYRGTHFSFVWRGEAPLFFLLISHPRTSLSLSWKMSRSLGRQDRPLLAVRAS